MEYKNACPRSEGKQFSMNVENPHIENPHIENPHVRSQQSTICIESDHHAVVEFDFAQSLMQDARHFSCW